MRTPAETALIERFEREKSSLPGAKDARAAAFARFEKAGLPGRRVESYHYTDIRNLMRSVAPEVPVEGELIHSQHVGVEGIPVVTFANGRLQSASGMIGAAKLEQLDAALLAGAAELGTALGAANDAIVDINTAFASKGAFISVPAGEKASLHLAFVDHHDSAFAVHSRVVVSVGAGAEVLLYESHEGPDNLPYQANKVVELLISEGAKVQHIRLNISGNKALALSTLAASLGADAELMSLGFTSGAETSRHQVFITYAGENAKLDLRGTTMIRGRQHADTTLVVDHAVPHGESRELFKTVVDGEAQGVFQGKIIVRPHAQKTDGQMASNALLLSDEAGMSNKPELEIFADDVVCAHGATCGALDENQLFYLMARGLPRADAEALLVEAFLDEALDAVTHEGLREALAERVHVWLSARKVA
ncbi:MAG: Fe-S cluster assembly protein SufD [Rhizobiales bacterium PAR1]|nr:MAG: Fe-S cluster assembly protein SufD [Rhizobiales bacterium PAR1]